MAFATPSSITSTSAISILRISCFSSISCFFSSISWMIFFSFTITAFSSCIAANTVSSCCSASSTAFTFFSLLARRLRSASCLASRSLLRWSFKASEEFWYSCMAFATPSSIIPTSAISILRISCFSLTSCLITSSSFVFSETCFDLWKNPAFFSSMTASLSSLIDSSTASNSFSASSTACSFLPILARRAISAFCLAS